MKTKLPFPVTDTMQRILMLKLMEAFAFYEEECKENKEKTDAEGFEEYLQSYLVEDAINNLCQNGHIKSLTGPKSITLSSFEPVPFLSREQVVVIDKALTSLYRDTNVMRFDAEEKKNVKAVEDLMMVLKKQLI